MNINGAIFSQAGAIIALLITIISLLTTQTGIEKPVLEFKTCLLSGLNEAFLKFFTLNHSLSSYLFRIDGFINRNLSFFLGTFAFFLLTPLILRAIIDHLSPEEYAKMSIGDLNQDDLLTFLAYKNWALIDNFLLSVVKSRNYRKISSSANVSIEEIKSCLFGDGNLNTREFIDKLEPLIHNIESYLKDNFKEIQQCIFLVKGSFDRLGIHKRELTHHILQFSPAIFYENLNSILRYLQSAHHLMSVKLQDTDTIEQEDKDTVDYYTRDFCYLLMEIITRRKKSLEELIFFKDIHQYLIGLSSTSSTSLSLKIFIRGLSSLKPEQGKRI